MSAEAFPAPITYRFRTDFANGFRCSSVAAKGSAAARAERKIVEASLRSVSTEEAEVENGFDGILRVIAINRNCVVRFGVSGVAVLVKHLESLRVTRQRALVLLRNARANSIERGIQPNGDAGIF